MNSNVEMFVKCGEIVLGKKLLIECLWNMFCGVKIMGVVSLNVLIETYNCCLNVIFW